MSYEDYIYRVAHETIIAGPGVEDPDFVEVPVLYDREVGWVYQGKKVSDDEAREIFIKLGKPLPKSLQTSKDI